MTTEIEKIMRSNVELVLPTITQILAYHTYESNPENWLTGGTGFFVDTGINKFLVTANHVYEEIKRLGVNSDVSMYIGGAGKPPHDIMEWTLIDQNADVDICIIQIPANFDFQFYGKRCLAPQTWPPARASVGDKSFTLGFPAERRNAVQNGVIGGASGIADSITNVGPYNFILADETDARESIVLVNPAKEIKMYGGMSGSSIFAAREDGYFEPVGVFIESGGFVDGIHAPFFGSHLDVIDSSGFIISNMIPPR